MTKAQCLKDLRAIPGWEKAKMEIKYITKDWPEGNYVLLCLENYTVGVQFGGKRPNANTYKALINHARGWPICQECEEK